MRKYTDYYNGRYNVFKENKAALYKEADELKELAAMIKAGLSEQQKADLDLVIDQSVSVPQEDEDIIEKHSRYAGVNWLPVETLRPHVDVLLCYEDGEIDVLDASENDWDQPREPFFEEQGVTKIQFWMPIDKPEYSRKPSPLRTEKNDAGSDVGISDIRSGDNDRSSVLDSENVVGGETERSDRCYPDHDGGATEGCAGLSGPVDTREDVEAQTPQDIAASLGEQGQKFAIGDVVIAGLEDEVLGNLVVVPNAEGDDLIHVEDEKGHEWSFEINDLTLIHHTDVPRPEGEGWERNNGDRGLRDVEAVCFDNGQIKEGLPFYLGFDHEQDLGFYAAYFKLKEIADEQDTDNGHAETSTDSPGDSGSSDGQDCTSGVNDATPPSQTENAQSDRADSQGYHPLAEWILQQEWRQPCPFGSDQILTTHVSEPEFFEDGTMSYLFSDLQLEKCSLQLEKCSVEDFLNRFTPKGWKRYVYPSPIKTNFYDTVLSSGQSDTNIEHPSTGWHADYYEKLLFIREHKEEDEDDTLMGPDNFQSREFVGEGEAVDVVNSEKVKIFDAIENKVYEVDVKDEQDTELEAGEDVQEDKLLPNVGVLTLVKFCGKENWRVDKIEPDHQFPYVVSHIDDNAQYTRADKHMIEIQGQAKELDEPNQTAVDLVEAGEAV